MSNSNKQEPIGLFTVRVMQDAGLLNEDIEIFITFLVLDYYI